MTELSRSQIDKLGYRLRSGSTPREDLELLQEMRASHDDALARASLLLAERTGLEPTSRLKTVGTIVEKLIRERGRLSTMQDIAGARIVANVNRSEQDDLVRNIVEAFSDAKVIDRRAKPSHGYRAVHVVVSIDNRLVEVQVRTELQNRWAQLVERLADQWGRQIRYGGSPNMPDVKVGPSGETREKVVEMVMSLSTVINLHERLEVSLASIARRTEQDQPPDPNTLGEIAELKISAAKSNSMLKDVLRDLEAILGGQR